MKKYTSTEVEEFVISHLYYSIGTNRMVWYDYKTLIVPQLIKKIKRIAIQSIVTANPSKPKATSIILNEWIYTTGDIDTILKVIKETYQLFGHYYGDEVRDIDVTGLSSFLPQSHIEGGE